MKYPDMNEKTKEFWRDDNFKSLEDASSIKEVFEIAKSILGRMPESSAQVCGPISNGGKGSIEENLAYLNQVIGKLQEEGFCIFDQMPFEQTFHRIVRNENHNQKYENILNDFYEPLFKSGRIKRLYFVPGWESSRGAIWEHEKAKELGIEVGFL